MKKVLNIQKLLNDKKKYYSVTISDEGNYFTARYYKKELTAKGKRHKITTEKYLTISNELSLPLISNSTVSHLGYKRYYYYKEDGFYINLYFRN